MPIEDKRESAVAAIRKQLDEVSNIEKQASKNYRIAYEKFVRWKDRTVKILSETINNTESQKFKEKTSMIIPMSDAERFKEELIVHVTFLVALLDDISNHYEYFERNKDVISVNNTTHITTQKVDLKKVFIIHGHDDVNRLMLEKLLKDRFKLDPIIIRDMPGKGRTIIEKFEEEARKASFVMALFTPDDMIEVKGHQYMQARPNVIFELGWFYGRLGRDKTCILFKKGTQIHSDLDGINRIEFATSIQDSYIEIEQELQAAGLL